MENAERLGNDGAILELEHDLISDPPSEMSVSAVEERPLNKENSLPEIKYSVDSSQQFSQYLNKESSNRYQAIVLNARLA